MLAAAVARGAALALLYAALLGVLYGAFDTSLQGASLYTLAFVILVAAPEVPIAWLELERLRRRGRANGRAPAELHVPLTAALIAGLVA